MGETYNNELVIKNLVDQTVYLFKQLDLQSVDDMKKHHALRLITNSIDVLSGSAIPQITEQVVKSSQQMIKLHLLHNTTLTDAQRKKFEILAFTI